MVDLRDRLTMHGSMPLLGCAQKLNLCRRRVTMEPQQAASLPRALDVQRFAGAREQEVRLKHLCCSAMLHRRSDEGSSGDMFAAGCRYS